MGLGQVRVGCVGFSGGGASLFILANLGEAGVRMDPLLLYGRYMGMAMRSIRARDWLGQGHDEDEDEG